MAFSESEKSDKVDLGKPVIGAIQTHEVLSKPWAHSLSDLFRDDEAKRAAVVELERYRERGLKLATKRKAAGLMANRKSFERVVSRAGLEPAATCSSPF